MNIYKRKDGLRVMEIEYGWGMDREAIEFPVSLAENVLLQISIYLQKVKKPELNVLDLMNYCTDVIENAKNGEITYILEEFWQEQINNAKQLLKEIKKICEKQS